MKIGIDYRLANNSYRGMARYCREIVKVLLEIDHGNEYYLIVDTEPNLALSRKSNAHLIKINTRNFIIGEQFCIPRILKRENFDLFWSPYNTFPVRVPCRTQLVVTVHDLIFFYPIEKSISLYQRIGALYRRYVLKFFYKKVSTFFTVSQFSKSELFRLLPVSVPVEVTYNCVDKFGEKVQKVIEYGYSKSPGNYFFTVSGDGPNKNLYTLLEVFEKDFPEEYLVVAGLSTSSSFRNRACGNISFLPSGISDEELIKAYLNCKCFLFCSKYEGFGIPLIEAAICRKPIIASNATAIPEILQRHGIKGAPTRDGIRDMINTFITSPDDINADYSDLISRFDSWEVPAKTVFNRFMKLK